MDVKRAKLFIVSGNMYYMCQESDSLSGIPNKNPMV